MKTTSNWLKTTIFQLHDLLQKERRIGVEILELLWELERRKAYAELGFDGLFTFCVSELKFTEAQAFQRIQAMRAMKAHPEIKEKLQDGSVNVTTVAKVQVFLRQEKEAGIKRPEAEAKDLFAQIENKSVRQVTEHLAEIKGVAVLRKLILELDPEAEELWGEVKGRSAHQAKGNDVLTFKLLMREWLEQRKSKSASQARSHQSVGSIQVAAQERSRYVPVQIRREVLNRDQHQCQNCGSKHAIQVEHQQPFAKGGGHETSNLKVLCRSCNLHFAVKEFGVEAVKR